MTTTPIALPSDARVREALATRRQRAASAWRGDDRIGGAFVVVPCGLAVPIAGTDQHYGFRAHDDHLYLSGSTRAGGVLVFDAETEGDEAWSLYVPMASATDRVWHGDSDALEDVMRLTGVETVRPLDELGATFARRAGRTTALLGNLDLLERPGGYGLHPEHVERLALDATASERAELLLHAARRTKDDVELGFMRAAARAAATGHRHAMRVAAAGMTEIELRIEIEDAFVRAGGDAPAYASIVAGGANAAVLHAAPTGRVLEEQDLVLIDAAPELRGYDSDLTRTFPVGERFLPEQRAIYDIVLDVQNRAIEGARPGSEYRELHLEACRGIARGLVDLGLLRGSPDDLVERDVVAVFFPHGLGHMIGLGTHDVGGYAEGRERSERASLQYLRADLALEPGHVVTIEPGIYFIDALLHDPDLRAKHVDAVDWALAESFLPLGGVRIEDDVHVRAEGPEVLTADAPKTLAEIEALRTA